MSGLIQMTRLGKHGRFTNQLFQYSFLRIYAKMHNLDVQVPAWCGNHLFGIKDYPVTVHLPVGQERNGGSHLEQGLPPDGAEFVNRDWVGYAQYHTSWFAPHKELIQSLFRPSERHEERLSPLFGYIHNRGATNIGIHLRRGDYGRSIFYITPVEWYLRWLDIHWSRFDNPSLFVATEDPSLVEAFSRYSPKTANGLGVDLASKPMPDTTYLDPDLASRDPVMMDFYPDFWLLSKMDVLLTPNSTFSFFAGMLNPAIKEFWRSDIATQSFEMLDPWNSYPLTHDKAEDYRDVPGVCLDETRYWKRVGNNKYQEKFRQHAGLPQ